MLILRFRVFFDVGERLLKIGGELDILWYDEVRLDDSFKKVICL